MKYPVSDSDSCLAALQICLKHNMLIQEAQGVIVRDKAVRGGLIM